MSAFIRIRFRTDGCFEPNPPAQPGDIWRLRWYKQGGEGPIAGYAICCPKCGEVHHWTQAANCARTVDTSSGVKVCAHSGTGSCWTWTGSAEEGTLTADPSLHASGACGWHGWLKNGVLAE
jgi:hypothetical protein